MGLFQVVSQFFKFGNVAIKDLDIEENINSATKLSQQPRRKLPKDNLSSGSSPPSPSHLAEL